MAPSHDCCQEALPFSVGLLECPHDIAGKFSHCNAGDPGSIPGSGRSDGEGIGYPLQYACRILVPQPGMDHARCTGSIVLTTGTLGKCLQCLILGCLITFKFRHEFNV